ncbi:SERTA domain-containing protein 3 isoform X2 [Antechinus flavipes]|nr:SERTA domain-containing protein 3 isoform X2 [Antechinus flavipes]XP_051845174.1 SERTA domain-containing protein 3 isoform X2 [Antechinus flavipes]XP_051845175.1 SERTA domain-containing protein 3 isoform X2 [Antechinus flavipes]
MVVGVKRKHPGDHGDPEEVEAGKESQEQAPFSQSNLCQTLLQLSMDKFQLGPPSLLRQVLITNTLNHLREKMSLEGSPAPCQGPGLEMLFPLTAQSANALLRELEELLGLRATQDCCEAPDGTRASTSADGLLGDGQQIPSPLGALTSPPVRAEEPLRGSFEIMSHLGDLVPEDFFTDMDTSDVEREPWPSASFASSSAAVCFPGQSAAEWDWTELDQILEIIKGS